MSEVRTQAFEIVRKFWWLILGIVIIPSAFMYLRSVAPSGDEILQQIDDIERSRDVFDPSEVTPVEPENMNGVPSLFCYFKVNEYDLVDFESGPNRCLETSYLNKGESVLIYLDGVLTLRYDTTNVVKFSRRELFTLPKVYVTTPMVNPVRSIQELYGLIRAVRDGLTVYPQYGLNMQLSYGCPILYIDFNPGDTSTLKPYYLEGCRVVIRDFGGMLMWQQTKRPYIGNTWLYSTMYAEIFSQLLGNQSSEFFNFLEAASLRQPCTERSDSSGVHAYGMNCEFYNAIILPMEGLYASDTFENTWFFFKDDEVK